MRVVAWVSVCLLLLVGCGGTTAEQAEPVRATTAAAAPKKPTAAERAAKAKQAAREQAQRLKRAAARKAAAARAKAAEVKAKLEAARKLAVQRQTELVRYGYEIVVDGDWGPRSREAWADLLARKKPAYSADWETSISALVSDLTNASETLARILNSLEFGHSYSKSELDDTLLTLSNCRPSIESYRAPLMGGYDPLLQLIGQGCAAYESAVEQFPDAFKSEDYFPFTGVEAALRQGDSRFDSANYELDGSPGTGSSTYVPPAAPEEEEYVPDYGGDLDCSDFDGEVDVSGGDPHGLDGDGDGVGCEQ